MVKPITNFAAELTWAGPGVGCVLCGSNVSREGAKQDGLVGVDLEASIEVDGMLGLCWDCAIQVGRAVNMERKAVADERISAAEEMVAKASELAQSTAQDASQARLDRDTVVRLLGIVESVSA